MTAEQGAATAGILTFLIADVRGYTAFTNEHGDEAAARLAGRFADVVEETITPYGGEVVELRGDEAMAVFTSARNALRAALAVQDRLAQEVTRDPTLPLQVGIGLDAGEAIPVRGGYRGGALNLAARLCSIAGAGEVFASEGVVHLARKTEGCVYVDRGEVRLKGLADPVRVMQIALDGSVPADLPALQQVLVTHPTNLPDEPTPFVGREREIEAVTALLREPNIRMVTLIGPGGTGKTRLSLQVGAGLLYHFEDGVFFVPLAATGDPEQVASTMATSLAVKEVPGQPPEDTLADALREKRLLLVLDNFEHLLGASSLVVTLLDTCPSLKVLVTSRTVLHLSREHVFEVPPLSAPDPRNLPELQFVMRYEAVALFQQRAAAAKNGFAVTDETMPAVAEICYRLDGLPLAIELAAARIRLFPPQALLGRLSSRLKLLTGGARDLPARHQTLRGTIDWSYSLLSEEEQMFFARLSVFANGCTLEAAEAVCGGDLPVDVLDGFASLVDKSLVRQEGKDEPRFSMLETIKEYARERLEASGELEKVQAVHADYFLRLAEEAEPELTGVNQHAWLDRLATEYENLRLALAWYAAAPSLDERGLRLASALAFFWYIRALYHDGVYWLERMLERHSDQESSTATGALWGLGMLSLLAGDAERAGFLLERSLALARRDGNDSLAARSLNVLGLLALFSNDPVEARRLSEESLELARRANDAWCVADVLGNLGSYYPLQGEFARAEAAASEALELARGTQDPQGIRMGLFGLALMAVRRGELHDARVWGEEGLAICRDLGELWFVSYFLWILALAATASGDSELARTRADESLQVARIIGAPLLLSCALEASAGASRLEGDDETAESLLAEAEGLRESGVVPGSYHASVLRARGELALAQGKLEPAGSWLSRSLEVAREVEDRWGVARTLTGLAALEERRNDLERAGALAHDAIESQLEMGDKLGLALSLERLASIERAHEGDRAARLTEIAREIRGTLMAPPDGNRDAGVTRIREALAPLLIESA